MAKFVFKLKGVLRQRKHVEQEKMRELAARQKTLVECQSELQSLNDLVQKANDDLRRHHLTGILDMNFLTAHRRFMLSMQRLALSIAQKIAAAQQRVTEARGALVEAAKQRKVLEKLRDQQYDRWRSELAARELREMDEIAMQLNFQGLAESQGDL